MAYYSVAFRIYSDDISPGAMTERIGIEPTEVHVIGQDRIPVLRPGGWSTNVWGYEPDYDRSASLEKLLKWLLQDLAPKKERIQHLTREAEAVYHCACFSFISDYPETTAELSPKTLAEMASYGATFSLSHYLCSGDDDDDDTD